MFKFDFSVDDCGSDTFGEKDSNSKRDDKESDEKINCYVSQEVQISREILENLDVYKLNSTVLPAGNITITYIVSGYLLQSLNSSDENAEDIKRAEQNHSDLIPGVYEGGAKIWECTHDLIKYMTECCEPAMFEGKRVLDLGCGSGLLGIYAYKCGAQVHFQDYNKDVLEQITIPNVVLNVPKPPDETDLDLKKLKSYLQFYSGDWSKYAELSETDEQFDVILTSETVYNPSNQPKLLNTLHTKLTTTGVVLVAAKTYYFGVGGGLRQFEDLIAKDDHFDSKVVWTSSEGVSREILELRKKKST